MGAEAICLGCTGMSTTGVAVRLREELKIPVIDPLMAAGGVALTAILQERVK
jgi:Asp/Glu/hydantoin racemase